MLATAQAHAAIDAFDAANLADDVREVEKFNDAMESNYNAGITLGAGVVLGQFSNITHGLSQTTTDFKAFGQVPSMGQLLDYMM